jgi:putative transposase
LKTEAGDGRQEGAPWWMFRTLPVGEDDEVRVTLDDLAREGALRMIAAALEAEVDEYVASFVDERDEGGKRLVVRNGKAKERKLTVGSGTLAIRAPRVNEDALGLSSSSIQRLTETWQAEHAAFRTRSLRFHRYAYLFVDGVNVSVRLGEDSKLCLLVVIGVREDGEKELLAVEDGYRESEDSWAAVLRDLRERGMNEPRLVTGDGALGAWAALRSVFPGTREQRCCVHKTANVLDALPKRLQPRAKSLLHEMAEAPTRADARNALERFRAEFDAKYPKAVAKLDKDWEQLTAVYSFPAEHWRHLRTTNPIESKLRHRQAAHQGHQGRRLQEGGARDGRQALGRRPRALAAVQGPRAHRRRASRRDIQGRDQARSQTTKPRRTRGSPPDHSSLPDPQHLTIARSNALTPNCPSAPGANAGRVSVAGYEQLLEPLLQV